MRKIAQSQVPGTCAPALLQSREKLFARSNAGKEKKVPGTYDPANISNIAPNAMYSLIAI
jgi:hypothetical protein